MYPEVGARVEAASTTAMARTSDGIPRQAWAAGGWAEDETTFLTYLQCCELCLAVQWLGWEPNWQAPPEHARDWLDVATRLAACLIQ